MNKRILVVEDQPDNELVQALAKQDQERREADAKEAEVFAETLPNIFRECDLHFDAFHRSFAAAIAAVNEGRLRGWNLPSQELFQAKLIRAVRTQLSIGELRMLNVPPLPSPGRCSFASLGESYARSILGGALHAVKPSAPLPRPQPQQAEKSDEQRLPPKGDVGVRLPGDGPDFEVRVPAAR